MSCPTAPMFTLSGFVSIDAGPDPDGLLAGARGLYPDSVCHRSRAEALQGCFGAGHPQTNIVGYGRPGIIFTGSGDVRGQADQFIGLDNFGHWRSDITLHRRGALNLVLCGCDTGAEADGATLLHELAKAVGGAVCAPTGLVRLNVIRGTLDLEPGAVWQQATETQKPERIDLLRPHTTDPGITSVRLQFATGMQTVSLLAIHNVRFFTSISTALALEWSGEEVRRRLAYFGMQQPIIAEGIPLAVRTGRMELVFRVGQGRTEHTRMFDILNDRILRDTVFRTVYYYANIDELRGLLSR